MFYQITLIEGIAAALISRKYDFLIFFLEKMCELQLWSPMDFYCEDFKLCSLLF